MKNLDQGTAVALQDALCNIHRGHEPNDLAESGFRDDPILRPDASHRLLAACARGRPKIEAQRTSKERLLFAGSDVAAAAGPNNGIFVSKGPEGLFVMNGNDFERLHTAGSVDVDHVTFGLADERAGDR